MLVGVSHPVEGPKQIIPSFVWLERAKQGPDFLRDVLGFSFEVGEIAYDRKSSILGVRDARKNFGTSVVSRK